MNLLEKFSGNALKERELRRVTVHVGQRYITLPMAVLEVGYTVQQPVVLQDGYSYNSSVNVARMILTQVNGKLYQLIEDRDQLHLYLPSVVDSESELWRDA